MRNLDKLKSIMLPKIGSTYQHATFGLGAIILHDIEGQNMLTGRPGARNLL